MLEFFKDVMGAMFQLPKWKFVWVNILFTLNMLALVVLFVAPHPVVTATAILLPVAVGPNFWMLWQDRGVSNRMSIPHLAGWIPQIIIAGLWLFSDTLGPQLSVETDGSLLYYWTLSVLVANIISVLFDLNDTRKWFGGEREVVRHPDTAQRLGITT